MLCCRWEFSVAVPLGMNVFLNAELLNSSAFKKTFMPNGIQKHSKTNAKTFNGKDALTQL